MNDFSVSFVYTFKVTHIHTQKKTMLRFTKIDSNMY